MLINRADIELGAGRLELGGEFLEKAKVELARQHPDKTGAAWRYAVLDLVEARQLGLAGEREEGAKVLADAREVIRARFGAVGPMKRSPAAGRRPHRRSLGCPGRSFYRCGHGGSVPSRNGRADIVQYLRGLLRVL